MLFLDRVKVNKNKYNGCHFIPIFYHSFLNEKVPKCLKIVEFSFSNERYQPSDRKYDNKIHVLSIHVYML